MFYRPQAALKTNNFLYKIGIKIPIDSLPLPQNDYEWRSLSFAKTKLKTNRVYFMNDFNNLNCQLKFNTYPISKHVKIY